MELPKNEATFNFSEEGDTTYKQWDGDFTVTCVPNILQRRAIEIEKSRLQADLGNPTGKLVGLAAVLANLRVRIVEAPNWWNESAGGYNFKDENVLVARYDKTMAQEDEWREKVRKIARPDEDETLGNESAESQ